MDFEDYLLEHSRTKKKHLLRCIELAKKFANKDIDITELPVVNQKLDHKHHNPSCSPSPEKPRKQAKTSEERPVKALEKKETPPEMLVIADSKKGSRAGSPVAVQDCKKDIRAVNPAGIDKKEHRPTPALLPAKPITWNPVSVPASTPTKPPSTGQPTDVKLPDPPSADKLIKPVSLPYLRQGVSVHVTLI